MKIEKMSKIKLNEADGNLNDLTIEIRTSIPFDEQPKNEEELNKKVKDWIIDGSLILLDYDMKMANGKNDLIYFNNRHLKEDKVAIIEMLSKDDLVKTGKSMITGYEPTTRIYTSEILQFKIILDEIPQEVNTIKIAIAIFNAPATGNTLKPVSIELNLINSGLPDPEIIGTFELKNYFITEQSAVIGELSIERSPSGKVLYSYNAVPYGYTGDLASIVQVYLPEHLK